MLDPISTLGVELHREIPRGRARVAWLHTADGHTEAVAALTRGGYSGNQLARAIFDLSLGEIRLPLSFDSLETLDDALGVESTG